MKQLSKTVILTRHHLTPLANMDMGGSDHLQCEMPQEVISKGGQLCQSNYVGFQLPPAGDQPAQLL